MATRADKAELATAGDLDRAWWEAAREHGFDARSVAALRERGRTGELTELELEARIVARLTEFDATFAPREARSAVALEVGAGERPGRALEALARLCERREVLDLADGRQTTRAHRALERRAEASAARLAGGAADAAIPAELVEREIRRLGAELAVHGAVLAGEQEQVVRRACSDARLVVVVGQAGTGKSTALAGVVRAHQAVGRELHGRAGRRAARRRARGARRRRGWVLDRGAAGGG